MASVLRRARNVISEIVGTNMLTGGIRNGIALRERLACELASRLLR
jgi:hypothetical protein